MTSKNGLELIKALLKISKQTNNYSRVLDKVQFLSAGNGQCVAEMEVAEEHTNEGGTLHGGCSATLVDCISSMAIVTNEGAQQIPTTGVSVDIHMSYLKPASIGDKILIKAQTLRVGKKLAFLEVEIRHKSDNSIIAKGSHTKFIGF